jgi:hypothetical protein
MTSLMSKCCSGIISGRDLAAPAEPDAPVLLEGWPQCHFEPARTLGFVAGNRNAV